MIVLKRNPLTSIFTFLVLCILLLQATDTYKLVLLALQQKTFVASIATLVFGLIYVFLNFKLFKNLLGIKIFRLWFNLIWTLPFVITLFHFFLGNINIKDVGYWLPLITLFGTLYVTTVIVFINKNSIRIVSIFYKVAILSVIVGFVIGFVNYDFLRGLMALSRISEDYAYVRSESDRAIGFFTQANAAARAIVLFSVVLFGIYFREKKKITNIIYIILFLFLVFLTGSRTSLILSMFFLFFYIPRFYFKNTFKKNTNDSKLRRLIIFIFFSLVSFTILIFVNQIAEFLMSLGFEEMAGRLESLDIFGNSNSLQEDRSVASRTVVINEYLNEIGNNILIGHGPALRSEYIRNGTFQVASQNQYLEDAFSYGVFYMFYYIYVVWITFKTIEWNPTITGDRTNFLKIFLIILFIYGFSLNYLLIDRIIIITVGTLISLYVSQYHLSKENKFRVFPNL